MSVGRYQTSLVRQVIGELVFVDILREFKVNKQLCATEKRHIVYTDSKPKTGQTDEAEIPGEWTEKINTNAVQLFRYSALTFNGHRIHYDRKYATEVEGYPGLVVHGPLLATMLSLFAERNSGRQLRKYSFKGKRPVFDSDDFSLTGSFSGRDSAELRVLDHMSQLSMTADAVFLKILRDFQATNFSKPAPVRRKRGRCLEKIQLIQSHPHSQLYRRQHEQSALC